MTQEIITSKEKFYLNSIFLEDRTQVLDGVKICLEILALSDDCGTIPGKNNIVSYRPKVGGPVLIGPQKVSSIHYTNFKTQYGITPVYKSKILDFQDYVRLGRPLEICISEVIQTTK